MGGSPNLLSFLGERTHRGFVVKPGNNAVAALDIELDEVDVDIRLAEKIVFARVFQLALENNVHAVLSGVCPNRQRGPQAIVGPNGVLLLFEDVQLAYRVDDV